MCVDSKNSKKTEPEQGKRAKTSRSRKLLYWLLFDLAVAGLVFYLLLYRPAHYRPTYFAGAQNGELSRYLTNELMPQIYNGSQLQEPFDLTVTQDGINDIVAHYKWPKDTDGIIFSTPTVFFTPGNINLIGAVNVKGIELIVTIAVVPYLDQQGLLNLFVSKIKIGAMNITPLARVIAKRMYYQRLETTYIDREDVRAKIAASLLNNEPFEPVFEIEDNKLRAKEVTITKEQVIIRMVPVSE
jgi:hypothetical protein